MSVGRSVFVDVLHKIDKADKVTDNRFKFHKNFFYHFIASMNTFFYSFITICDYLDRCRFQTLRGKVNEACPFGYRCTRFWTPDLTFGQKRGKIQV